MPQQHTKHSKILLRLKKSRLTQVLTSAEHLSVCTLKRVAVPVRLGIDHIGQAILLAARTRPKFIGGCRAVYDDSFNFITIDGWQFSDCRLFFITAY